MAAPLSHIRVVEAIPAEAPLALRLAAAMTGRVCAELGAHVIVIEPQNGDELRRAHPLVGGSSAVQQFLGRGKTIVAAGSKAAEEFYSSAEAVFTDAAGLDKMRWVPPVRVVFSMNAAGAAARPSSEFTIMAQAGMLDLVGDEDHQPLRLGGHQLAYAAGLAGYSGFAAVLSARARDKSITETVNVSLADVAIWLNWKAAGAAAWGETVPHRQDRAEWRAVRCADGYVGLVYRLSDWPSLCVMIGDPRLNEPRFADRAQRATNMTALVEIIEERFALLPRHEIFQLSLRHRLPLGPIWSPDELREDAQYRARRFLQPMQAPSLPIRWDAVPRLDVSARVGISENANLSEKASLSETLP